MSSFVSDFQLRIAPVKVRFGAGVRRHLAEEVEALGACRALILSTSGRAETARQLASGLGGRACGTFAKAAMHTPVEVTREAVAKATDLQADCIIAVGGGSTTGLGKAIAYRTDLPQIVVPTTYSGSEATPILGQTENGIKTTLTDSKVQPEVILYDAELVQGLPVGITVTSALNAMAHAVETLYAKDRNPLSSALALEGLKAFREALPAVIKSPHDLNARGKTLYGAWLCGSVLGQVGMALHHKLCHTLGGSFGLPHAETHAILLPHTAAYNEGAVREILQPAADLFGGGLGDGLYAFAGQMGAPRALRDIGLNRSDLDKAVELAVRNPYWNPRPVERSAIRELLQRAFEGAPPEDIDGRS